MQYSFCPKCGRRLSLRLIDQHERLVCSGCGFIFYQNSKPCVGVLVVEDNRLLLVQRAIEPFKGYWDIPGGFLEAGEHPEAGAIRELQEETGLLIEPVQILGIFMDTYGPGQEPVMTIFYIAQVAGGELRPGSDAAALQWFELEDLPEKIAFSSAQEALELLRNKYDKALGYKPIQYKSRAI